MIEYAPPLVSLLVGLAVGLILRREKPPNYTVLFAHLVLADFALHKALKLPFEPRTRKGRITMDVLILVADGLFATCQQASTRIAELKAAQEDPAKIQALTDKLKAADDAIKAALA